MRPSLRYIEYHITDYCNLKCKGCGHRSNLVKDMKFADIDEFQFALEKLAEKFYNIEQFRLMGGEPLLCSSLHEYIDSVHAVFPYSDIKIVSNGILYKRINERIAASMRNANAQLQISQYPPTGKLLDEIIFFCEEKNIQLQISEPVTEFFDMEDSGLNRGFQEKWNICGSKNCHFLNGTRLYPCIGMWVRHRFEKEFPEGRGVNDYENDAFSFDLKSPVSLDGWDMIKKMENPFQICEKCGDKIVWFQWESEA